MALPSDPPVDNHRSKAPPTRLAALEGLRGLAALVVVFAHLTLGFAPDFSPWLHETASHYPGIVSRLLIGGVEWMYDGHYAVWVFWVMSAVVLSLRFFLWQSEGQSGKARSYLYGATIRRYPRLVVPILASVLIGYLLHVGGLMHNTQAALMTGSDWLGTHYTFSPSFVFAMREAFFGAFHHHDMGHTYNAALWTMHAELVGSIFVFTLMWVVSWIGFRWIIYAALSGVLLVTHFDYLNGFLAGLVMCDLLVLTQRKHAWRNRLLMLDRIRNSQTISILVLIIVLLLVGQPNDRQMMIIVLSVVTCGLVLLLHPLNRWLSTSVPVYLGKISFGVYLVHVPVLTSYSSFVYVKTLSGMSKPGGFILILILTLPAILLAGHLFHYLVDTTAVRWSKRLQEWVLRIWEKKNVDRQMPDVG